MRKTILNILLFILLSLVFFSITYNPNNLFSNIIDTLNIWVYKVIPSIFTFYILTSALISFKIIDKLFIIFKPLKVFFRFDTNEAFNLFILSIFLGNPSTSNFIIDNLSINKISRKDAQIILKCGSFISPLFIISFLSFNLKYAFVMCFVNILSNFILCFILTKKNKPLQSQKNVSKDVVSYNFLDSIYKANNILLLICGTMIIATIIRFSFQTLFNILNINNIFLNILISLTEISTGLNYILNSNIPNLLSLLIMSFMLGFGGGAIHLQVYSIIFGKLSYLDFFTSRLLQGLISTILFLVLYNFI